MWFLDLETFSNTPLTHGVYKYAEDCEVLLVGYADGDQPAKVWDAANEPMPADLKDLFNSREEVVIHNGLGFDRVILEHARNFNFVIPVAKVVDTMVMAYRLGLPGSLAALCNCLKVPQDKAKDKHGKELIRLFCRGHLQNNLLTGGESYYRLSKADRPEEWKAFIEYSRLDVEALREVYKRLAKIIPRNWQEELVDCEINERGIPIDLELAEAAIEADERNKESLNEEVSRRTGGALESATQRDAFIQYVFDTYGWKLDGLSRPEVERRINDDNLPVEVRDLLVLRLKTAKTSVKKYQALLDCTNSDGRLRGTLQYFGARTGRWAGRLFQVQNLPRPSLNESEIEIAVNAIKMGFADHYEDVGEVLSSCIRAAICATDGKTLIDADFSSVESRVLAWLAGEEWKLQAFRDLDNGIGFDPYQHAYAMTFNTPVDKVTKKQRQMGKPIELGMGFGGGVGAFLTFANVYRIDLTTLGATVKAAIDSKYWLDAQDKLKWALENDRMHGLDNETWTACEAIKLKWRHDNANIAAFWRKCESACDEALNFPEKRVKINDVVSVEYKNKFLVIWIADKYAISYPGAVSNGKGFSFKGVDQYTKKWTTIETHGGKIAENITQAVARCLLAEVLFLVKNHALPIVMHVHDEILCEVDEKEAPRLLELMIEVMKKPPKWAKGLPLNASGWIGKRFRKD